MLKYPHVCRKANINRLAAQRRSPRFTRKASSGDPINHQPITKLSILTKLTNDHHNHRESSIQYRVLSIKNADTFEQKSNFSRIFIFLSQNELRATSDEKRLYFRIKSAGSSNYRGSVFYSLSLPEFIPGFTYTALLPGSVCSPAFLSGAGGLLFSPPAKRCQILRAYPDSSLGPAGQGTNMRLRLRCPFRLLSFGYVLKDALRLTQPKRAAHPFDEIRNLIV